ncbi:hypothetical protein GGG16DRAFT_111482 [Schizophyllum commune]
MKESSESSAPPTRSDKYYLAEGDVIFRIERTLFRFHSYHLSRATTYFDNLLETTPPASWNSAGSEADDRPIALDDVRAGEFEALLWFFYESGYSWAPRVDSITNDTNERWESVVLLAEKYAMPDIARVATCALIRGEALLDDIRRISLCAKHGLSKTLVQGELQKVISRETPLSAVEMRQLGFDVSAVLARAREEYAHSAGRRDSDCDDSICDTCDAYAPCHMGMHICLNNYEHSHACPEPSDVNPIIDSIDWEGISRAIHRVSELQDRSNAWGSALGDLYIKVEGKILQLHSYHLKRATRVFSDTLSLPDNPGYVKEGAAPTHPKALEGAHTDWNALIWFFYDSPYEWCVAREERPSRF